MLTVHHLATSQSERIVWLLDELGLDYELVRYERDPVTRTAPPQYKALHPFGTAPVITDGDLTLGETGAIVDYVLARYGAGRLALAPDHPDFARYLYWLHFANGSLMPSSMIAYVLHAVGAGDGGDAAVLQARLGRALEISEQRLGEAPYFGGDVFTAADILMVLPLRNGTDPVRFPNIHAYLQRIAERPAYQRAMGKAEPDGWPT